MQNSNKFNVSLNKDDNQNRDLQDNRIEEDDEEDLNNMEIIGDEIIDEG